MLIQTARRHSSRAFALGKATTLAALLAGGALALGAAGCSKKPDAPAAPEVKWPAQPADGAPIALEFEALEGEGDGRKARFRVFNFSDKAVTAFHLSLSYQDAEGKELKTFPHSHIEYFKPKSADTITAGFFLPPETVKVAATVRKVTLGGGAPEWTAPEKGQD